MVYYRTWQEMFPGGNPLALDLIDRLLQFNPDKHLSARQALMHPYLAEFQGSELEPTLDRVISIKIDDDKKSVGLPPRSMAPTVVVLNHVWRADTASPITVD